MDKDRLAAFSDGVIAIIITIMVLELKIPQGKQWGDLQPLLPQFLSYALSFLYVGIYWNNHHHMLQTVERVNGAILWANTNLLFWLSLIPFATAWLGENQLAVVPTAFYGIILLFPAVAYVILQKCIIRSQGPDSLLAKAIGNDFKGKVSAIFYVAGISWAFIHPLAADAIYALVAALWLVPDPRIEKMLGEKQ